MQTTNEIREKRVVVHQLHCHLVFVTKYRKTIFTKAMYSCMTRHMNKVCNDFASELMELNGEKDHVHLLITYPPHVCLSKLVNSLKGVSSRALRKEFKELEKYYFKGGLWSPSYFAASCGGAPLDLIAQYIQNQ